MHHNIDDIALSKTILFTHSNAAMQNKIAGGKKSLKVSQTEIMTNSNFGKHAVSLIISSRYLMNFIKPFNTGKGVLLKI